MGKTGVLLTRNMSTSLNYFLSAHLIKTKKGRKPPQLHPFLQFPNRPQLNYQASNLPFSLEQNSKIYNSFSINYSTDINSSF